MGEFEEDLDESREEDVAIAKSETIKELIKSVNEYIAEMKTGEITKLVKENVLGLEEALVYQEYLENLFGWRIPAIDKLIAVKCTYTKSIDGWFIDKKLAALEKLQAQIQAQILPSAPSLADKLMGVDHK
jgi:hypothetical protein